MPPAGPLQDGLGQLQAAGSALVDQVVDAVAFGFDELGQGLGCVRGVGGVAELVRHHLQGPVTVRCGHDLAGEVASPRPEEPGHPHDVEAIQPLLGGPFPRGLAPGIDAPGLGQVVLPVEAPRLPGEDLVGADLDHGRTAGGAALRQVARSQRVHRVGLVRRRLGLVHLSPGCRVDEQIWGQFGHLLGDVRLADVPFRPGPGGDLMAGRQRLDQGAPQLTVGAGDQDVHGLERCMACSRDLWDDDGSALRRWILSQAGSFLEKPGKWARSPGLAWAWGSPVRASPFAPGVARVLYCSHGQLGSNNPIGQPMLGADLARWEAPGRTEAVWRMRLLFAGLAACHGQPWAWRRGPG